MGKLCDFLVASHLFDVHVPNILIGVSASVEVPLVTIMGRRIGLDSSGIAFYATISSICRLALDIPCSVLVEYIGVLSVMLGALVLNTIASAVGLAVDSRAMLACFCVLSGVSLGAFFLARHVFVAGISSKKHRGTLMAFLSGLLRWSHVIGPAASALIISKTGNPRASFWLSLACSGLAALCVALSTWHTSRRDAERKPAEDAIANAAGTPLLPAHERLPSPAALGSAAGAWEDTRREHEQHASASATGSRTHPVIIGGESEPVNPYVLPDPPHSPITHLLHQASTQADGTSRLGLLWATVLDCWPTIWRLGLYIILSTALRSNRKLMLVLGAMSMDMSDAEVSFLTSVSFVSDAVLFPLGGIIMDKYGRQFAMVPPVIGFAAVFCWLSVVHTRAELYVIALAFGVVDALGCGLLMTITADRAPKAYGAPFFGIMRTLQDLGHVFGAASVAYGLRLVGFRYVSLGLAVQGVVAAVWSQIGVPTDDDPPCETPRLSRSLHSSHTDLSAFADGKGEGGTKGQAQYGTV